MRFEQTKPVPLQDVLTFLEELLGVPIRGNKHDIPDLDDLLQTPEINGPIQLVQPKVFWQYADESIESRSAGQKLLIRMGPANARVIKAKLREFRAEIVKKK